MTEGRSGQSLECETKPKGENETGRKNSKHELLGKLGHDMSKKAVVFSVCFLAVLLIFLIAFCRPNPEGGFYWTFITYAPVISSGDGSSFKTAYLLEKGQDGWLTTMEIETIRDKYWVTPQRSYEDFYHECYDTLVFTNANLNGRAYNVISFTLPEGTNTVYFDVTYYKQKGQH